jgi:hypothetical protein
VQLKKGREKGGEIVGGRERERERDGLFVPYVFVDMLGVKSHQLVPGTPLVGPPILAHF